MMPPALEGGAISGGLADRLCLGRVNPQMARSHADRGLVAIAADDKPGTLQVDGIGVVELGGPIDDHLDMGSYRKRTAAAEAHATTADIAGNTAAPPRGCALLGDAKVNREMNDETLIHSPFFIGTRHLETS